VAFAFSRLGETSSPERDGLLLKTRARRLSDSSCKFQGATSGTLAWARLARLGEISSLGRKYQGSPLFTRAKHRNSTKVTVQPLPSNHNSKHTS